MPIKIPATLPAHDVLRREGVMVMSEETALRQDIRPLQIGLVNLMPKKVQTETQFARLIGATPLQIELTLIRMSEHQPKNTSAAHLEAFYQPFREARQRRFDGLIVTGAPIEHLEFEAVSYWERAARALRLDPDQRAFDDGRLLGRAWRCCTTSTARRSTCCRPRPSAASATSRSSRRRRCCRASPTASSCRSAAGPRCATRISHLSPELRVLIHSEDVGPCLIEDAAHRAYYMFNHLEYDSTTLKDEYERDLAAGGPITAPVNYFPDDDPAQPPENRWRSHGQLLYGNWINADLPDHALRGRGDRRLSDCRAAAARP